MKGDKKQNKKRKGYRTKVCKRCDEFYLSHTKGGKVCDNCNKMIQNRIKKALFSRIQASEQKKRINMNKYAVIDSKGKIIEKFRTIYSAKYYLNYIKVNYYEELNIIKLEGGKKLK